MARRVFRESDVIRDDQGQFAVQGGVWAKRVPDTGRQRGNQYGKYEWMYSHDVSRDVTTRSARLMGLPYQRDPDAGRGSNMMDTTPGQRRRFASSLLKAIDGSNRSGQTLTHPVYHGTQQKRFANAKVGDIVKVPLTATSYYRGMASGFTMGNQRETEDLMFDDEARAKAPKGTLVAFPVGTPYVSIDQNVPDGDEGRDAAGRLRWVEREALVAGTFRVRSVTRQPDGLDVVELEQVSTFAPETGKWTRSRAS
jgi:hypothetical protein